MADLYETHAHGLDSPPARLTEVTPDDGADLPFASRAINVTGAGAVTVTTTGGDTGTIHVAAGIPFPLRARRIHASGTTATGIVVLF